MHASFSLDPKWVDLTPDYDPSARASELDILQGEELDIDGYSVVIDWQRGGVAKARTEYNDDRKFSGLPKVELDECRTVLMVFETRLFVTCFLEDLEYSGMMGVCEKFAAWPNPKSFVGGKQLHLLNSDRSAALDEDVFMSFWRGKLPLFSRETIHVSFIQNVDLPAAPTVAEKRAYHLSQV